MGYCQISESSASNALMSSSPEKEENAAVPELDVATLGHIFAMLDDADDVARCGCVCTSWRSAGLSVSLWDFRLRQDFGVEASPDGASWPGPPPASLPISSPRDAWVEWNNAFVGSGGPSAATARRATVKRMTSVINRLKAGLLAQGLEGVVGSFKEGIALNLIDELEERLPCKLPGALRVLWATCGGQDRIDLESQSDITPAIFWGALGGYGVYDILQSMRLADFDLVRMMVGPGLGDLVPIAANFNRHKRVLVNCVTGEVLIWVQRMPLKKATPALGSVDFGVPAVDAPVLLWLENYVQMLEDGVIGPEDLYKQHQQLGMDSSEGICLFPRKTPSPLHGWPYQGPIGSEAITHGVKVTARPLHIPELDPGGDRMLFAYSIRMELLPDYALRQCQLVRRHWIIRDEAGEMQDEVQGEGVVGEFPVLVAGGDPFVYQSCTTCSEGGGSMEGTLEFVVGSLTENRLQGLRAASWEQAHRRGDADEEGREEGAGAETLKICVAPFFFSRPAFLY